MSFEIHLSNGKTLSTEHASEVACFYESRGESIVPEPEKKPAKKQRNRKPVAVVS